MNRAASKTQNEIINHGDTEARRKHKEKEAPPCLRASVVNSTASRRTCGLLIGAAVGGLFATAASAAPIVTVPSVTASGSSGDLQVSISDSASESIYGYSLEFQIVPQSGATGSITFPSTGGVTAAPGALFGSQTPGSSLLDNTDIYASDFDFSGPTAGTAATPLLDLNFTIAPGTAGTFDVEILQDPNSVYDAAIDDGTGMPIAGAMFNAGSITVAAVPEPAALGLAAIALSLTCRRRRTSCESAAASPLDATI